MSTDEFLSLFGARDAHEPRDPMKAAQGGMRNPLPRRFYQRASLSSVDGGFALHLDGKSARTPARNLLVADNEAVAAVIVDEWSAQKDLIDPATMPVTRLLNAALDGVAREVDAVQDEIVRYGASDLICYRAGTPKELAALQAEAWDPLFEWAREHLGAAMQRADGVVHVSQPPEAISAVAAAVARFRTAMALAALSSVTTLTGSAIVALALAHGRLSADQAWLAAHVDEDYQSRVWGADDEAVLRQANRRRDFDAAALVLDSARMTTA